MKIETLRTDGGMRLERPGRACSHYRMALVRAMAHAEPSAPARRSSSIADRHQSLALN